MPPLQYQRTGFSVSHSISLGEPAISLSSYRSFPGANRATGIYFGQVTCFQLVEGTSTDIGGCYLISLLMPNYNWDFSIHFVLVSVGVVTFVWVVCFLCFTCIFI